uniref:Sodium channel regulatory subunit beta-3 n=1 Tax=Astyanax mexicanus TaxID=7994 RepID=A0A8B9H5B9_ASTMX
MLCLRRANEKPACTFLSGSSSSCTLLSDGACVEVDSDTEAVVHGGFKLGCISCKMRGEVEASATVDWWFMAKGEEDFTHIYSYADMVGTVTDERFVDRLDWNGSKKTVDLQDGSIYILNVTFNDTGTYRCYFDRMLNFEHYEYRTNTTKFITINVVAKVEIGFKVGVGCKVMVLYIIIYIQLTVKLTVFGSHPNKVLPTF